MFALTDVCGDNMAGVMSEQKPGKFVYNDFFSLCEKGYHRFGDILDLPDGTHPYEFLKKHIEQIISVGGISSLLFTDGQCSWRRLNMTLHSVYSSPAVRLFSTTSRKPVYAVATANT